MERYGWTALRAGLSSTSGLGVQQNGMVDVKGSHLEQCLELYWQHVHHVLPIIHRPTFSTSSDAPLPTAAMIALGAQLSTRPDVRAISKSMYDFSIRILATVSTIYPPKPRSYAYIHSGILSTAIHPYLFYRPSFYWRLFHFIIYRHHSSKSHNILATCVQTYVMSLPDRTWD